MSAPKWAEGIVERFCDATGKDIPELTWRRSKDSVQSSGRYIRRNQRIIVTAGTDRQDQRLVLLHELAHHLTPEAGHDEAFWTVAWRLFQRYGLTRYALTRETPYRAAAGKVALALGIRGAPLAVAKASARRQRNTRQRNVCPMPAEAAAVQGYRTPHTHYVGTIHRWHDADGYHDEWTPPS